MAEFEKKTLFRADETSLKVGAQTSSPHDAPSIRSSVTIGPAFDVKAGMILRSDGKGPTHHRGDKAYDDISRDSPHLSHTCSSEAITCGFHVPKQETITQPALCRAGSAAAVFRSVPTLIDEAKPLIQALPCLVLRAGASGRLEPD